MRIISKFRDYYDIGMQYGIDEELVWIRETEAVPCDTRKYFKLQSYTFSTGREFSTRNYYCKAENYYIAFCGGVYPVAVGVISEKSKKVVSTIYGTSIRNLKEKCAKAVGEEVMTPAYEGSYFRASQDESLNPTFINSPCHDLHIKMDCPVLLISHKEIVKCPVLKDYGFHKIKDPYNTYQEIAMYISGVMGQKCNPTADLSDKSKVLKHGFDPRYGFRTRPKQG